MKTPLNNKLTLVTLGISALHLIGCSVNQVTDDFGTQPDPEIVTAVVEPTPRLDTQRLEIPTLPAAPEATPEVASTAEITTFSVSPNESIAPVTDRLLPPADTLPTLPSPTTTDTLLAEDTGEPAITAADTIPIAATTPVPPAESAATTDATVDVKERLQRTDDISVITWRAERGHVDSQLLLGKAYATGERVEVDLEQARLWLELASIQGNRQAQYELGKMYFSGTGVNKNFLNAREWWIESAISGSDKAQQKLGYLYSEGLGVERDFDKAKNWYLKAANLGNAEAQTLLGSLYHEGNRLPENYDEAIKWYRLAARQGHPHAQYALGILYHDGLGTEADPLKCAAWVDVAVANGYTDDLGAGKECRSKLDQQSTIEADILANEWKELYITGEQS